MWILWTNYSYFDKNVGLNIHCQKIASTKQAAILKAKSINKIIPCEHDASKDFPNIKFNMFDKEKKLYVSRLDISLHKHFSDLHVLEIICSRKKDHVIKYCMDVSDKIEMFFDYDFDKMKQTIKLNAIKINELYNNKSEFDYLYAVLLNKSTITISDTLDDYKFVMYSFDIASEL